MASAAPLTDEVCVVTGGASGIGRAMAERFASAGMRVVIGDIEQSAVDATIAAFPGDADRVLGVTCDVRSADDVNTLRDAALDRFGDVHVVCLNAGVAPTGTILDTPLDVFDWVFDVNVRGVVLGVKAFAPLLVERGRGHIVCTASVGGLADAPTVGAYGATKHAVVGLAAALRKELSASGVGVSVLCPGKVDTKIFESERNRPEGMADPSIDNPSSKMFREMLATGGAPPAQIADYVLRAVLDDQFVILPTFDVDTGIGNRIADIHQAQEWRDRVSKDL